MRSNHQFLWRCTDKRQSWLSFAMSPLLLATVGCSGSPEFNILGSYFPSWLVCLAIAIALTFLALVYAKKKNVTEEVWPLPIVSLGLLCLFRCTLWLILFR